MNNETIPHRETTSYQCDECGEGILTINRVGIFCNGKCDSCGHTGEFELPDEALAEEAE